MKNFQMGWYVGQMDYIGEFNVSAEIVEIIEEF